MKKIYFSAIIFAALVLSALKGHSQGFTSIDIHPGSAGSNPSDFIEFNNKLYFSANDGTHGEELWVSDGTVAGTTMVKDIWPGPHTSQPLNLTVFKNRLYFNAYDSIHGNELWISDGTDSGTVLLADIYKGHTGSYPGYTGGFVVLDSVLIFTAADSAHGNELWKTNGTATGTVLLADIYGGTTSGNPGSSGGFIYCNGKVFFGATNATAGAELWETDGTTGGTIMVADIYPGFNSSYPGNSSNGYQGFYALNNEVFFEADNGTNGTELWKTDGTTNGTQMVADIWPGAGSSNAGFNSGAIVYNGKLYFSASDSIHGTELWVTDGTGAGTSLVKDIYPGTAGSNIGYLTPYAGRLYFSARDTDNAQQLYVTDGTPAGTLRVSNLDTTVPYQFLPTNLLTFNNQLYMVGNDSTAGGQLFVTTGADTGITLLTPPVFTNGNSLYGLTGTMLPVNNMLAYAADYNSIGYELWFYTPAVLPNGIKTSASDLSVTAYPNPFTGNITLMGLQAGVNYTATILDITGRVIEQQKPDGNGTFNTPLLTSGMYLLQVCTNDKVQTFKIIKQ